MNANRLAGLIAVMTVGSMCHTALAQSTLNSRSTSVPRDNALIVASTPIDSDYYGSRFSSTNAEGLGRGLGAFATGVGEMNLYNSMASANYEEARRRAIENRRAAVENYFAIRRINEEYREEQLHRRGSMIHTVPLAKNTRAAANQTQQFTATIDWPKPLQGPEYSVYRKGLESRFARTDPTTAGQRYVRRTAEAMKEQLKADIRETDSGDYVAAKKFIDDLAYRYDSRVARRQAPSSERTELVSRINR